MIKKVRMGIPSYKPFMDEMNRTGAIVYEINKNWLSMMNDGTLYEKEAEMLDKPLGKNASFLPPFQIDLGCQITIGDNAFVNHGFTASAAGGIDNEEGVMIADQMNADEFEIVPVSPYPEDYDDTLTIAQQEAEDNALPEYQGNVEKWSTNPHTFHLRFWKQSYLSAWQPAYESK